MVRVRRPNTATYWGTQRLQHRYRIERLAGRWYVSILGRKFAEGFASDGYRTKEGGRRGGHPPRQGRAGRGHFTSQPQPGGLMTITIKGRKDDYAADRLDCQNEHGVFESHAEREEWRKGHEGHDVDLYPQAHVSSVPFPPAMGYQPGMGPLHPARSPRLNPS